jgi:replicative DNA helicase
MTQLAYQEEEETPKILDKAEQKLFAVSQRYLKQNFIPLQDILPEAFDRIDEMHKEKGLLKGLATGFNDLDNILAGLQKSNLIILAARPSVGKSSLALDFARHAAIRSKAPVGILSLEMSKEEIVDRLLCAQAGVSLWKMRTGHLSENPERGDFPKIGEAMSILSEAPIFIDDSPTASILEIRTKARKLHAEHNLGLLIVDYLQLMDAERESRVQEVSEISRGLKAIAKELRIPVLAISQLSRAVESRTPPIPKLSDLRESGSLEQDADVVLFIYREELYKRNTDKKHIADVYIAKHRSGPANKIVNLYFEEETASFKDLSKEVQE